MTAGTIVTRRDAVISAGRRLLAAAALMAAARPVFAQPALAPAKPAPAAPAPPFQPQSRSGGVLTPPAQVDPGMTRPVPDMPARSTPVIHPRELRKGRHGGVEVVPK